MIVIGITGKNRPLYQLKSGYLSVRYKLLTVQGTSIEKGQFTQSSLCLETFLKPDAGTLFSDSMIADQVPKLKQVGDHIITLIHKVVYWIFELNMLSPQGWNHDFDSY